MSNLNPLSDPLAEARARIQVAWDEQAGALNLSELSLTPEHLATLCPEIATLPVLMVLNGRSEAPQSCRRGLRLASLKEALHCATVPLRHFPRKSSPHVALALK
jgi:hypothetical protein